MNDLEGVALDLSAAFTDIENLLSSNSGVIFHKRSQLAANQQAKNMLKAAEEKTKQVNKILDKQVDLANQTTTQASELVKNSVSSGNTQTAIIMAVSILIAIIIARYTLVSITGVFQGCCRLNY